MGPPSSGGILLAQMMKMVEQFSLKDLGFHSVKSIHLLAEIERRSFADRSKHLGDPDFYPLPIDFAISAWVGVEGTDAPINNMSRIGPVNLSFLFINFCCIAAEAIVLSQCDSRAIVQFVYGFHQCWPT